jgi:DNA-binding CsgD family transcriptional regulator
MKPSKKWTSLTNHPRRLALLGLILLVMLAAIFLVGRALLGDRGVVDVTTEETPQSPTPSSIRVETAGAASGDDGQQGQLQIRLSTGQEQPVAAQRPPVASGDPLSDEEIEAMGYGELVSLCREAAIRNIELLEDDGRGGVSQIEVENRLDEDRLDSIDSIEDWEFITQKEDTYLYLLEVRALDMPERASVDHDDLVGVCEPTVSDRGVLLSLVGSQESIRKMLRNFEEAGIAPDLHRLGEYEGGQRVLDTLTDRQLEVLQTAYYAGYFEWPRHRTGEEIADDLDIAGPTFQQHLRTALDRLLEEQFGPA